VGAANKRYFQSAKVPDCKLFFSPHAIDNARFAETAASAEPDKWRTAAGIPGKNTVILFVGKFIEKKRPLDLIRAFKKAALPDATLVFLGSGRLEEAMHEQSSGAANIIFVPFQNQSAMPHAYAAADIIVLPSYGPYETWGLCINEAMACGKAVIASDHVGCAEDLVQPGRNGLIFPAGDADKLADCLARACANKPELEKWGTASRNIIQGYSYEQATDGLLTALRQLTR
jgi:glycosyltransferase involved in cell wall biosynthesis